MNSTIPTQQIFNQVLGQVQYVTQDQILGGVKQVWNKSYPFPLLIGQSSLKS